MQRAPASAVLEAMATQIGLRFFLFEADGSLRRLPHRVVSGLIHGDDRLLQYAGQRLRSALAILRLRDGKQISLATVEASWWEFAADGSVHRSRLEALRDALNAADDTGDLIERSGNTIDLAKLLTRRRAERRWRWTPTPTDITRIVHAIWPKIAGRPVEPPPFARGTKKRRHPMSYRARNAERQCHEHVWKLRHALAELNEHDLKGLISGLEDRLTPTGEGDEHLWRGVKACAEWQLEARRARRSKRGTWYVRVDRMVRDPGEDTVWSGKLLELQACDGRDAAVAVAREFLAKHAIGFDHDIRIEVEVCPEIEWVAPGMGDRDGDA